MGELKWLKPIADTYDLQKSREQNDRRLVEEGARIDVTEDQIENARDMMEEDLIGRKETQRKKDLIQFIFDGFYTGHEKEVLEFSKAVLDGSADDYKFFCDVARLDDSYVFENETKAVPLEKLTYAAEALAVGNGRLASFTQFGHVPKSGKMELSVYIKKNESESLEPEDLDGPDGPERG